MSVPDYSRINYWSILFQHVTRVVAACVRVEAMKAGNADRERLGQTPAYVENAFEEQAREIERAGQDMIKSWV